MPDPLSKAARKTLQYCPPLRHYKLCAADLRGVSAPRAPPLAARVPGAGASARGVRGAPPEDRTQRATLGTTPVDLHHRGDARHALLGRVFPDPWC